ncbi:MAG: hypothetical protein BMS9Abin29_1439 [Gemmatimonadota bacterium]|nr:MAG: hypothetical protein BMS9Abin29_1439 [Gemmatimonadota bacterium]
MLSSGSWDTSIVDRNAFDRLEASRLPSVFAHTDYVFFRAEEPSVRHPEEGLTVYEIAGRVPGGFLGRIKWIRRIQLLRSGLKEIEAVARANPPDVVVCVDPFVIGLIGLRLARRLGRPMVLGLVSHYRTSYEVGRLNPIPFLPARLTFMIEAWVMRRADLVLVHCDFYREYAVERGALPDRVRRFPCYADAAFYGDRSDPDIWRRLGVEDPAPLVYVGRLSPEKYSIDLIRCFGRIREEFPERELVVVGGAGPLREDVIREAEKLGVAEGLRIVGNLGTDDVFAAMARAGVVLAPHAGYSLLETALAGAPIVAYDFEWHPEIITHQETGLLVPYRDWKAMADATVGLLREPARAAALGRAARERCMRENRREHTMAALAESYRLVLGAT